MKLYYSSYFGLEFFWSSFDNVMRFVNFMGCMCFLHIFLSIVPCVFGDALGLMDRTWGDQLYITMIETAILELVMFLFIIYEF
jgi:hypothetical protein